jgi:hypothetical protein
MSLLICPIPDGAGYWHQLEEIIIDPINGGELITTPNGKQLLKYAITAPFSIDDYSEPDIRVRNMILMLFGDDCDYTGNVYYDNIGFSFRS